MRVIGVDLAWSGSSESRSRTGLCSVEDGRVRESDSVRKDDEIEEWIRGRWTDDILLAIDAPIRVPNKRGCRPCETVLAEAYGSEEAGPFPANRQRLGDRPRAQRLADTLGLSVDPATARDTIPTAIEVYPHPAPVSLFGLAKTLKYKRKRRRALAIRRDAFAELFDHLLELKRMNPPLDVTTSSRWKELRREFAEAQTHGTLDVLEDELDAYVCAYVGIHHLRWAGSCSLVVGDLARGYIVTPVDGDHARRIRAAATRKNVPVT